MTHSDPFDRAGRVIDGLRGGLGFALPCSLVPILVHLLRGPGAYAPWSTWGLAGAFIASGAVGGLVYGLLHSWRSSPATRFARGVVIALAVMPCVLVFTGEWPDWTRAELKCVAAFALIGGAIDALRGGPRRESMRHG